MWALLSNKPEVAIFLLEQPGININHTTDSGTTALHQAARSEENIEVLALLLKRPEMMTINKADRWGHTPLFWAVDGGATKSVELLLRDARTDPDWRDPGMRLFGEEFRDAGDSPLMRAMKKNNVESNVECIRILLGDNRVDLTIRDKYRWSGKEWARLSSFPLNSVKLKNYCKWQIISFSEFL